MPNMRLFPIALLAAVPVWAQPPAGSRPASSNIPGAEYPRVYDDLRVTFQLKAPDAKNVQVRLGQTYDMARSEDGCSLERG